MCGIQRSPFVISVRPGACKDSTELPKVILCMSIQEYMPLNWPYLFPGKYILNYSFILSIIILEHLHLIIPLCPNDWCTTCFQSKS